MSLISFNWAFEGVFAFTALKMQLDASSVFCIDQGGFGWSATVINLHASYFSLVALLESNHQ